jgi:hypothetical protein
MENTRWNTHNRGYMVWIACVAAKGQQRSDCGVENKSLNKCENIYPLDSFVV